MRITKLILRFFSVKIAYAHCDIPCGIYDPHLAQVGAHTVIRMTQLLLDLKREDETKAEHDIARLTHVKEKHGDLVEEELGTLENDYFKPEHYESYPELKGILEEAIKLSIKTRVNIDLESSKKLLDKVLLISEIFYKSKGFEIVRIPSGFPTEGEIVSHK